MTDAAPAAPAAEAPLKPKPAPMFRLVDVRRAWWPVMFAGVTEEGEVIENRIELRFRIIDEDEKLALVQEANAIGAEADAEKRTFAAAATELLCKFVDDWRGVAAENGEAVKFGPEPFARLLSVPNVYPAILRGFAACRAAVPETREGN